jgi:hypothetical protein
MPGDGSFGGKSMMRTGGSLGCGGPGDGCGGDGSGIGFGSGAGAVTIGSAK